VKRILHADVAIVGGGIVGTSAALSLRRMGMSVVLLERDLCGSRSSGVNYGGVRRQGRPVCQLPLAQRAHGIWARLPELIGIDGEYVRSGHFKIAFTADYMASLETFRDLARDFGLNIEMLTGEQLRTRCPWVGSRAAGGSLCPDDGQANPRLVSPAFGRAAQQAGAEVLERTPVDEVEYDGRDFVLRSGGALEVRASQLLNCAGAWAGWLASHFGEPVPMRPGHPAMAVTAPLPHFLDWSLGVEGDDVYCRQVARGNVVLGGTQGVALDADRARCQGDAIASLAEQAVDLLPGLRDAQIIRTWSGTEGYLPDRQPVLGPSSTMPGLLHGFGFAGAGFQIGPAAGEVLAELARHGVTSTPIDHFSIHRFLDTIPPSQSRSIA